MLFKILLTYHQRIVFHLIRHTIEIPLGWASESVTFCIKTALMTGAVEYIAFFVKVDDASHVGAVGIIDLNILAYFIDIEIILEKGSDAITQLFEWDADLPSSMLLEKEETTCGIDKRACKCPW